ncbi:hypothetical protein MLD38_025474 [Melastoma candidum]|uniref:Uncharacterized protein n=1 Tax=Melastoma candidum TaxID=119954 RepID=A0ACB9NVK4_9MYRT|nr:hypothetical protein MLD38_025474 [Melastoma candidum]
MKVEVISTDIIKPSIPTPDHLWNFGLSLFDQLTPVLYTPIILYYPMRDQDDRLVWPSSADSLHRLRSSLSVVLSRFYPLAGRMRDNMCIECDDRGAKFLEAKVNCELSEVLTRPSPQLLRMLLPAQVESLESRTGHLLLVQANLFECRGLAIGICVSHKIADAGAMSNFIKSWADVANEIDPTEIKSLGLNASSLVPPLSHFTNPPEVEFHEGKTTMKRYVFSSSSLAALVKEIASEGHGLRPTRLEAVSALLWKCLMETSKRIRGCKRRSFFSHAVNLRGRMPEPFPKVSMSLGNLLGGFRAEITEENEEIHLAEAVRRLQHAKEDYFENFVKNEMVGEKIPSAVLGGAKAYGELLSDPEVDFYNCTSWCKFPLYDADFGWGKPVWASVVSAEFKDAILMIDGRGGEGMEVWLSLEQNHMAEFEREEDLLRFASLDPSITW